MPLLAAIGGARTAALQTGQVDATIFGSPQTEIQLTNNTQNLTLLAYIPELFPGYQGSTYNVRPEVVKVGGCLSCALIQSQESDYLSVRVITCHGRRGAMVVVSIHFRSLSS
jgi:hypothetical protein